MSHPNYPQTPQNGPSAPPIPPAPSTYQGQYPSTPQGEYQPGPWNHGPYSGEPGKSFMTTWLLSVLLGTFGADRFYLGKTGTAVAKLLTAGGAGIWAIVDLIMTLTGNTRDKAGRPLEGYQESKKKAWIITAILWLVSIITGILLAIASIAMIGAAVDARKVPVSPAVPSASQAAPAPSGGTAAGANSVVATVSEGNTAKISVLDSLYTPEIPGMDYLVPKNGGFLALNVSWEALTGTSFSSPSNFKVYDADGKEGELVYLDDGLGALPTDQVGAGDARKGVIAFDVKKGPVKVVINDDYGDPAGTLTPTVK